MSTNSERAAKLINKLVVIDTKMEEYRTEREGIVAEINAAINGETAAAKTSITRKPKTGSLGDKIKAYLQTNPGPTMKELATKLHTKAQKVSLSLYHLIQKEQVFESEEKYFLVDGPLATPAKMTPAEETE